MPASFGFSSTDAIRFLPEIILTLTGILIMFLEAVLTDDKKGIFAPLSIVGLAAALVAANRASDFLDGARQAALSIDSGAARAKLDALVAFHSA